MLEGFKGFRGFEASRFQLNVVMPVMPFPTV